MSNLKRRLVLVVLLVIMSTPLLTTDSIYDATAGVEDTSTTVDIEVDTKDDKIQQESPELYSNHPQVISLDGSTIDFIPDFVKEDFESTSMTQGQHSFALADVNPSKPNITDFRYFNMTAGDGGMVTWMNPEETVQLWFKAKGPMSSSGPEVHFRFDSIVSRSTDWGYSPIVDQAINDLVNLNENESAWFYGNVPLPVDTGSNYGWGAGLINAFTMSLYQPFILFVQDFEEFYGGLYDKSSYLHMFGEVYIKGVNWYNYTYDSSSPEFIPCTVAERNWAVFAEFDYWVINAPVWGIGFKSYYYREIVWWPDDSILISDDNMVSKQEPGTYTYRPETGLSWTGWLLEEDWVYGNLIGQTPGLYMKLHFYSGGGWSEVYNSKESGDYLHLVENILEQPPQVEIYNPMDGEVIGQSTTTLRAIISDPNSNRQITEVIVHIDGVGTSIFSFYDPLTGLIELDVEIPQDSGSVNITLQAIDTTGRVGSSTVLVISDNPLDYFPSSYTSSYDHYVKTLSSQVFTWQFPLTFSTGSDLNISLTPRVEVGFDLSLSFDVYHSRPSQTYAGQEFTTYVSVSDPAIDFSAWFTIAIDYDIKALSSNMYGSLYLVDESWDATRVVPLGIDVLDLRYDLPGISEVIRRFTHYEIGFLDHFPIIGDFVNLDLIVDIIPLLKMSNLLTATVSGTNCAPERSSIGFVSDKMFALTAIVDDAVSGGIAEILLNDVLLESTVGLDLWANLTLNGGILGYSIANIDMNQWLYENLGIMVPHLSLWNSKISLPVVSQIALGINVAEQQTDVEMKQVSADENQIDVTVFVEDEQNNGVPFATVVATIGPETCNVIELGSGQYVIEVPYRTTEFILAISVTKTGYIGTVESYTLYVDPLTVDSTPPSIMGIAINPVQPSFDDVVTVSASITDDLTVIINPTLHYSLDNGQSWISVSMSHTSGSNYASTIPTQPEGTEVLYYISVFDGAGNEISSTQLEYIVSADTTPTETTTDTGTTTSTGTATPTEPGSPPDDAMGLILLSLGVAGAAIGAVVVIVIMRKRQVT